MKMLRVRGFISLALQLLDLGLASFRFTGLSPPWHSPSPSYSPSNFHHQKVPGWNVDCQSKIFPIIQPSVFLPGLFDPISRYVNICRTLTNELGTKTFSPSPGNSSRHLWLQHSPVFRIWSLLHCQVGVPYVAHTSELPGLFGLFGTLKTALLSNRYTYC